MSFPIRAEDLRIGHWFIHEIKYFLSTQTIWNKETGVPCLAQMFWNKKKAHISCSTRVVINKRRLLFGRTLLLCPFKGRIKQKLSITRSDNGSVKPCPYSLNHLISNTVSSIVCEFPIILIFCETNPKSYKHTRRHTHTHTHTYTHIYIYIKSHDKEFHDLHS